VQVAVIVQQKEKGIGKKYDKQLFGKVGFGFAQKKYKQCQKRHSGNQEKIYKHFPTFHAEK
jgi:hypothetical protein